MPSEGAKRNILLPYVAPDLIVLYPVVSPSSNIYSHLCATTISVVDSECMMNYLMS